MKKVLLLVIALLLSTNSFSKEGHAHCKYVATSDNILYISDFFKFNSGFYPGAEFEEYLQSVHNANVTRRNGTSTCQGHSDSLYFQSIRDFGESSYYKNKGFKTVYTNWKPGMKFKKKRIIKTKPQKTIVTNSNDYTNEGWWKNATLEQVKQAIRNGLNPNELFGNAKETALHLAIYSNNPEIIEYVIKSGANINAKNKHGKTPLDYAEYGKNDETIDTLKRMAKSLRYKRTPFANECVSIPARKNKYNNSRDIKNTCNFWVNVWVCDKGYQYGCDSRKGLIDAYINEGDGRRNQVYGDNHFTGLVTLKAGEQQGTGSDREKYTMNYFACKGRYSHIVNDKKGATGFKCRTREDLLDKYGWGE